MLVASIAMAFGILIHRSISIYDDTPIEKYQFPKQYLDRARACIGDWIVYYEPRKVAGTKGYHAVAKVERIIDDSSAPGMYLALFEPGSYLDFASSIPFDVPPVFHPAATGDRPVFEGPPVSHPGRG